MSLDKTYVLAVDLGTSACKTALITASGRVLGWESEPLPLHVLRTRARRDLESGTDQDRHSRRWQSSARTTHLPAVIDRATIGRRRGRRWLWQAEGMQGVHG